MALQMALQMALKQSVYEYLHYLVIFCSWCFQTGGIFCQCFCKGLPGPKMPSLFFKHIGYKGFFYYNNIQEQVDFDTRLTKLWNIQAF